MPIADPDERRRYQREWKAKRRADYFADKVCAVCGGDERLELDHIDPARKVTHKIWTWRDDRRLAELAKCQVLCHEHHLAKTAADRRAVMTHGTRGMYTHGRCRCASCRAANAAAARRLRRGDLLVTIQ